MSLAPTSSEAVPRDHFEGFCHDFADLSTSNDTHKLIEWNVDIFSGIANSDHLGSTLLPGTKPWCGWLFLQETFWSSRHPHSPCCNCHLYLAIYRNRRDNWGQTDSIQMDSLDWKRFYPYYAVSNVSILFTSFSQGTLSSTAAHLNA